VACATVCGVVGAAGPNQRSEYFRKSGTPAAVSRAKIPPTILAKTPPLDFLSSDTGLLLAKKG
jgi:hypothetical protein